MDRQGYARIAVEPQPDDPFLRKSVPRMDRSKIRYQRQRGNQLLEVALIFFPMFALFLALVDIPIGLFLRATMQHAVREGVRYAVTHRTLSGMCQDDSIRYVVKGAAAGFLGSGAHDAKIKVRYYAPGNLDTELTGMSSNAPGNIVEVAIEGYAWNWLAPLLRNSSSFTINVYAADRMEGVGGAMAPPCR